MQTYAQYPEQHTNCKHPYLAAIILAAAGVAFLLAVSLSGCNHQTPYEQPRKIHPDKTKVPDCPGHRVALSELENTNNL